MGDPKPPPGATVVWRSIAHAAAIVDKKPDALRRGIERRAYRAADGAIEAQFDGIRARKVFGRWRVLLGPSWLSGPDTPGPTAPAAPPAVAPTRTRRPT